MEATTLPTKALAVWLCQRFGKKRKSMLATLHTLKVKKSYENSACKIEP